MMLVGVPEKELETRDAGVRCPKCHCRHCPVVRVRHKGRYTRRKRECRHCANQFWERSYVE